MKNLSIAFLISLGLLSCTSKKSSSDEAVDTTSFETTESEINEQVQEVIYQIPSPAEIPFLLEQSGAEYMDNTVNGISRVEQYLSSNHKAALNIGIYSTDIGYLIAYEKNQDALNYIAETRKLAEKLGLNSTYSARMLTRFESNLNNRDSLASIINEAINSSNDFLRRLDRKELSAKIVAGSFVEGLYISTQIIKNYPDFLSEDQKNLVLTNLMKVIVQQQKPLAELVALLDTFPEDEELKELKGDLSWLLSDFESLNLEEELEKNQGGIILKEDMLSSITNHLEVIRGKMIS